MVDGPIRRSRRLRGLSPMSVEPSSRRCRSNFARDLQSVEVNTPEIDPLHQTIVSQGRPSASRGLDRDSLFLSRAFFWLENEVEVEEILESPMTNYSPLPPNYPDVL